MTAKEKKELEAIVRKMRREGVRLRKMDDQFYRGIGHGYRYSADILRYYIRSKK